MMDLKIVSSATIVIMGRERMRSICSLLLAARWLEIDKNILLGGPFI
jgi:hypothetical protein